MKNIHSTIVQISLLALMFTSVACSGDTAADQSQANIQTPVSVSTYTVGAPGDAFLLPIGGQVVAADRTYINAKTNGYVSEVVAELGESVNQGQILARISNEELSARKARTEAMVQEAQSGFELAEIEFNRMKRLVESGSATQREFDMAKSQFERAQAGLLQAKKGLEEVNTFVSYTVIKAPFAGTITEKMIDEGALIDPSRPLFVLETDATPEVEFFVPTGLYNNVKEDMNFAVTVEGMSANLQAKVIEISSSSAQAGGQFRARLAFVDEVEGLLNGSYAKVLIPQSNQGDTSIRVPNDALVRRGELVGIYVISAQGKAMLRWVRTGKSFSGQTEVLSGLGVGEKIILNAPATVADGVAVKAA